MATAVATATRPAASKDVHVPTPRALVERFGGIEKFLAYLERMEVETDFLARSGGGKWLAEVSVNGQARGGGAAEISTGVRRKV